MSSAKAETDPLTLAIATAVDTVTAAPSAGESTPTTPQIHVHHFHHQSCLHHPEVLCTTLPTGVPVVSRSEDDYAVVFNSSNATRSPFRPTLQPFNNKLSTVIFTAPRKTVCTATIRHPSLASLVLHQPRNTHSLEPVSPSNSSFFNVSLIWIAFFICDHIHSYKLWSGIPLIIILTCNFSLFVKHNNLALVTYGLSSTISRWFLAAFEERCIKNMVTYQLLLYELC